MGRVGERTGDLPQKKISWPRKFMVSQSLTYGKRWPIDSPRVGYD